METEVEMEIDPVRPSESRGGRPAEEREEANPFVSRKKVKVPEKIESVLAEELKDLEEELSHAARTERENSKLTEIVKGMGPLEVEEALSIGHRRKVEKPDKGKAVHERQPEAELEEALSLAVRSGLAAEEVRKFLRFAVLSNLMDYDVHSLAVKSGLEDEDAVSLAKNFLTMYRIVFRALHAQLLGSFDRRRFDPELCQWKRFGRFFTERKKKGPEGIPFLLFKIKASAKNAKVTWWRKEYAHFPPERSGYTGVLRLARLVVGRDGSPRLEEAGEDGQPGALSHGNGRYTSSARRVGVLKDGWLSPLDEVAVVRRLPGGEGIYIMSYVDGLGVKLGEFLFVLHMAWTVALSFTERAFYVSSEFTEETLYAVPGVHFIDITIPVEHLIKKLYQMYEQEEQDKKTMLEKQDPMEMVCQQEELGSRLENEERKKEDLRRRKEHKLQPKNKREAFRLVKKATRIQNEQRQNEGYDEDCVRWLEESDWVLPFDEVAKPGEAQQTS
ncbi:uncharacterized protein [Lolium perenne]|uniref:uncharacterized protein n=1 Tax=Lolium perenne TaxID=4522 RepID=UPI0021EA2F67|nr:uncharacterized protein LOC127335312 [Lolium perenne]